MDRKQEIKQSLDIKYYKVQISFLMIIYGLMAVLILLMFALKSLFSTGLVVVLILTVLFSPFWVYYFYRYFRVINNTDVFEYHEVVLNEPHLSFLFKSNYFTVTFVDNSGRTVKVDTKAIFGPSISILLPLFDDYFNQKVLIAYNPKYEEVIVIKKLT